MSPFSPASVLRHVLQAEARLTLRLHSPRVLVLTGSAGKTGAKDLITPVLGSRYTIRSTGEEGNQLLPMAILGLPPLRYSAIEAFQSAVRGLAAPLRRDYPEWLILEVDASAPGRAVEAGRWLHPEIVVFTSIGRDPPHLDAFTSREQLILETAAMCEAVPARGVLIVNGDDEDLLEAVAGRAGGRRLVRYGFGTDLDVRGGKLDAEYRDHRPRGLTLDVETAEGSVRLSLPGVVGRPHAYAAMAAAAVGMTVGVSLEEVRGAIASAPRQPGRLRILDGVGGSTLIDDSWNPSPIAWAEALRALGALSCSGRKFLIAAGVRGGQDSIHREFGREAAGVVDLIVCSGAGAEIIAQGARDSAGEAVEVVITRDPLRAAERIAEVLGPDDIVLVTAANTGSDIRMEHAVERLLLRAEDRRLLVRQRPWWPR